VAVKLNGCWPATYKPDDEDVEPNTFPLDLNHTHFILVDNGQQGPVGGEIDLRTRFESRIAKLKAVGGKSKTLPLLHVQ